MSIVDGYLNQTVTVNRAGGGYNDNEEPITTQESVACRLEQRMDRVINSDGREVMSEAKLFTIVQLTIEDTVVIDSKTYPVLRVDTQNELNGDFSHYESYVGRSSR